MVYDAYNLTGMGNSTGIVELMQTVNSNLMFDFFGLGVLLTIFIIAFSAFLTSTGGDTIKALAGSSYIAFIISLLLMILGLIPNYIMYVCLVLAAVSVISIRNK